MRVTTVDSRYAVALGINDVDTEAPAYAKSLIGKSEIRPPSNVPPGFSFGNCSGNCMLSKQRHERDVTRAVITAYQYNSTVVMVAGLPPNSNKSGVVMTAEPRWDKDHPAVGVFADEMHYKILFCGKMARQLFPPALTPNRLLRIRAS
ncbi:hypothetical protein [Mycobacterium lepromatosis]|nr:hypothetical protein [Mycobacterium lepromatosis]